MAFDAGAVEATLTLSRDPFQRGLREARAEADAFQRNDITAKLRADAGEFDAKVVETRRRAGADIHANLQLDTAAADAKLIATERLAKRVSSGGIGSGGSAGGGGVFGRGGFFDRHAGPGLLGSAVGLGAPLIGPLAGLGLGAGASFLTPITAGLAGVVPLAAVAKTSLTTLGKDIQTLTKYQQQYNLASTDKQRQAILTKEAALWKGLDGPQRQALKNLQGLEGTWHRFQRNLQPVVFKDLAGAMPLAARGLHLLMPAAQGAGNEISILEAKARTALQAPFWHQFSQFLGVETPRAVGVFGTALGHVGDGLAHLVVAFAPLGHMLENDITKWSRQFDAWTQGQGPGRFVAWVEQHGPPAAHELGQLAKGVGGIFKALTPVGMGELRILSNITNWLLDVEKVSPGTLTAVGGGILAIMAALKVGHGVSAGLSILRDLPGIGKHLGGGGVAGGAGGVLGKVLGSRTGVMNVEAGIVNVNGRGGPGLPTGKPTTSEDKGVWNWVKNKAPWLAPAAARFAGPAGVIATVGGIAYMIVTDPTDKHLHQVPGQYRTGLQQTPLDKYLNVASSPTGVKGIGGLAAVGSLIDTSALGKNAGQASRELLKLLGPLMQVAKSARDVRGSFDGLRGSALLFGTDLKHSTTAVTGAKIAFGDTQGMIEKYVRSMRNAGASNQQIAPHVAALEREFERQAVGVYGNKAAVDRLLGSYHLLPRQLRTLLQQRGAQQVENELRRLKYWQDQINRHISVQVSVQTHGLQNLTRFDPASQRHATGGLISGPGSGTSDSISARLSTGEYVINAAAVRRLGVPFLNSLNHGAGAGGGGYATGGFVPGGGSPWNPRMLGGGSSSAGGGGGGGGVYDAATARVFLSGIARALTGLNSFLTQGAISADDTALSLLRNLAGKVRSAHDPLIEFIESRARRLDKAAQATAKYGKALAAANDQLQNDLQARASLVSSVTSNAQGFAGLGGWLSAVQGQQFDPATGNPIGMPVGPLPSWLQGQKNELILFLNGLRQLKAEGLSPALIAQIAQLPPDQGLQVIAGIMPGDVRTLNTTEAGINQVAGTIGSFAGNAVYGSAIAADRKRVAELLAEQKRAVATLQSIDRTLAGQARRIGEEVAKALRGATSTAKHRASATGAH